MRALFRQFSFPGGIPSHVAPGDARLDPRGRRARLRAGARLRRRLRQPGPARRVRRRRRRGRDRPAGRELALQQVPQPGAATARCCRSCTSTATRSPTRRCWPASREDELRGADARLRLRAALRRRRRPGARARAAGRAPSTRSSTRSPRSSAAARTAGAPTAAPAWPMIVLRTPEGLDRPEGGRRPAGRGHLPRPPGAARRDPHRRRSTAAMLEDVAAQLPAGGAVRRRPGALVAGAAGARARRATGG